MERVKVKIKNSKFKKPAAIVFNFDFLIFNSPVRTENG